MKALTICQPYSEMIAAGEKPIENRSWSTLYRGPLAIHAGKSRAWMDEDDERKRPGMAFGALVATARLIDCVRVESLPEPLRSHEAANGPWCWVLAEVKRLPQPIPWRGAQGLFDVPDAILNGAEDQHARTAVEALRWY